MKKQSNEIKKLQNELEQLREHVKGLEGIAGHSREIQETLEKRQRKLDSIFRAAPVGIGVVVNRVFTEANDYFCKMTGYSEEELIGKNSRSIYPTQEEFDFVGREKYRQITESGTGTVETRWKRKDGGIIDIILSSTPIVPGDLSGEITFTALDITERKKAEEALRMEKKKLLTASWAAQVALWEWDISTGVLDWSDVVDFMLGYKSGEKLSRTIKAWEDIIHKEDRELVKEKLTGHIENKAPYSVEYRVKRADGSYVWWHAVGVARRDKEGRAYRMSGACVDITERKHMEEMLNQKIIAMTQPLGDTSGITFYDLFDINEIQSIQDSFAKAAGVASIITEIDGTPITRPSNFCRLCNDIIRQTPTGRKNCYYSDSVIGRYNPSGPIVQHCLSGALWDAGASITVGNRHIANWLIGQVIDEQRELEKMMDYAREIGADEKEYYNALKEVKRMPEEQFKKVSEALFLIANQLSLLALQNIQQARDIAERKRVEEALKQSEEKYRLLFEHITSGFALHEIICDDEGNPVDYRFLEINPAFEKYTGLSAKFLLGKTILEAVPNTEKYWIETYGNVALSGKPVNFENYFEKTDKYYNVLAFRPKKYQFAVIFSDITERKKTEETIQKQMSELEAKNAELERFTYTVSHDLKSPLITIKGFLGHLISDAKSGKLERMEGDIKRISNAADKMQDLLNDLLELSRIGRIINPSSEFSMSLAVQEAVELVYGFIKERGIKFSYDENMPSVLADRVRMREVWQNLIENAVKYMGEQKHPEIAIGYESTDNGPVFYIKDNACGIEEKYQNKIFGLFDKLDPRSEGTGIGLALVSRIIELHGGQIWMMSEGRGKGSVFYFTIADKR